MGRISSYCKEGMVEECPIHLQTQAGKKFVCQNPLHSKKDKDRDEKRTGYRG